MSPDPLSLVTLPLRVAFGAARLGFSVAEQVVGGLLGDRERRGDDRGEASGAAPMPPGARVPATKPRPTPSPRAAAPPVVERDEPPEPEHVSEEPVLVAESADPGAEEGVGASLTVAEPWEGYRRMRAEEIVTRIESASREELAVVELYETMNRRRKTVLAAAELRLKALSPPRSR